MIKIGSYDKNSLVRSGIIGSILKFSKNKEVLIYLFLDYLYLYFQPSKKDDPLVFIFWEGDRCIFSSFNDLYYTKKYGLMKENFTLPSYRMSLYDSGLYLSVHKVNSKKLEQFERNKKGKPTRYNLTELQNVLFPVDIEKTRSLETLFKDSQFKSFLAQSGALVSSLSAIQYEMKDPYMSKLVENYEKQIDEDLDMYFVKKYTDGLREVLDECWEDIKDFLAIGLETSLKHDHPLGNIFCVIRMAYYKNLRYNAFPYTAKILLSKSQKEELEKWVNFRCNNCNKENCPVKKETVEAKRKKDVNDIIVKILETPLSNNARAIADLVFCSGIVEFGREPSEEIWDTYKKNSETDKNRQIVETCIYPSGYIYYVPIHVGGHPWLALFTFSSGQDRWLYNYTFYRDIISVVATKLRLKALDQYIIQVANVFKDEIKKGLGSRLNFIQRVNKKLKNLARIYPFPLVQIEEHSQAKRIDIFYHRNIPIVCRKNFFFGDTQVSYDSSNINIFLERISSYLTKEIRHILEIHNLNVSMHTAYFSHEIPNHISKIKGNIFLREYKKALRELDYLLNFCNLAMAAVDERRRAQLRLDFKIMEDFIKFTENIAKKVLKEIVERFQFKGNISFFTNINKSGTVLYINEYFQEAIYEVILNAVKYSKESGDIEIILSLEEDNKIFLIVSNYSKSDFQDASQKINALIDGSSASLGVGFLNFGATACNYSPPQWECKKVDNRNYAKIITKIQIAKLEEVKNEK